MITVKRFKNLEYAVRIPNGFSENKKYPLVIYIHGAGARGTDIQSIVKHGVFTETEKFNFDAIFVAPQCYEDSWFCIFEQLQEYIIHVINQDYVDIERVYALGASMGGYTTWQIAMSRPDLFAAIVPICGGGMYWNAGRLKNIGIWAFHGSDDPIVYCEESKKMVQAVNENGGNARLTIFDGVGHASWTPTFKCQEMWQWLFEQRKAVKVRDQ